MILPKVKEFLVTDHERKTRSVMAKSKREAVVIAYHAGGYTNPRCVYFWNVTEVAQ